MAIIEGALLERAQKKGVEFAQKRQMRKRGRRGGREGDERGVLTLEWFFVAERLDASDRADEKL